MIFYSPRHFPKQYLETESEFFQLAQDFRLLVYLQHLRQKYHDLIKPVWYLSCNILFKVDEEQILKI